MNAKKIWDSYKFPLLLLGGIFTGAILGIILGEKAKVLAPLGDIFLNLMFAIVVPMVYVSITTAVGNMVNMKRLGKILGSLVCTFIVTGGFAAALVLVRSMDLCLLLVRFPLIPRPVKCRKGSAPRQSKAAKMWKPF